MPRRFLPSQKLVPKSDTMSETVKIGVDSIFFLFYPNKRYAGLVYTQKLVRPPNMGAKFPPVRIWYLKPSCQKRTPKIGVRFWQHTLGCQIRSAGSLASISRRRMCPSTPKHKMYRIYEYNTVIKKFWIFSFLII